MPRRPIELPEGFIPIDRAGYRRGAVNPQTGELLTRYQVRTRILTERAGGVRTTPALSARQRREAGIGKPNPHRGARAANRPERIRTQRHITTMRDVVIQSNRRGVATKYGKQIGQPDPRWPHITNRALIETAINSIDSDKVNIAFYGKWDYGEEGKKSGKSPKFRFEPEGEEEEEEEEEINESNCEWGWVSRNFDKPYALELASARTASNADVVEIFLEAAGFQPCGHPHIPAMTFAPAQRNKGR